jgi:hypothetical protein
MKRRGVLSLMGASLIAGCSSTNEADSNTPTEHAPTRRAPATPTDESTVTRQPTQATDTPSTEPESLVSGSIQTPPDIETSEFDRDKAGDGIPDPVVEYYGADPETNTLLLELTEVGGATIDTEKLTNYYQNVGVENPDGSTGFEVHIERKQVEQTAAAFRYYHHVLDGTPTFQRRWKGFHHLVVLPDAQYREAYGSQLYAFARDGDTDEAIRRTNFLLGDELTPWTPKESVDWADIDYTAPSTYWWERLAGEPVVTSEDTSGDGITAEMVDEYEILRTIDLSQKNLVVEAVPHETSSREIATRRLREVQELFRLAPVKNPDGSMGIKVHYIVGDPVEYMNPDHFEYRRQGSRPIFLHDRNKEGLATGSHAKAYHKDDTFCHELGHLLGLLPDVSPEIDRESYWSEYPSCMNYDFDFPRFCADEGTESAPNDWKVIEQRLPRWRELMRIGG